MEWLLPNSMLLCSSKALCCVKDVCSKQMIILTPCYFSVSFLLPPEQITQSKTNLSASSSSASKETPSSPSSSATKGTPKLDESIELDPSTMRSEISNVA